MADEVYFAKGRAHGQRRRFVLTVYHRNYTFRVWRLWPHHTWVVVRKR